MDLIHEDNEIFSSAMNIHVAALKKILLVGGPLFPTEWSADECTEICGFFRN